MKTINRLPTQQQVIEFNDVIMRWAEHSLRSFPWRKDGISNYSRIISEILLQRTRAYTVAKIFPDFINKYPDWGHIIKSDPEVLEQILKPLGLQKRRARGLKDLAESIKNNNWEIPSDRREIEALPTVGQYIANAIELLIFERPRALLDVNMARVLERYFGPRKIVDIRYDPFLQSLSQQIVESSISPIKLNFAILDYAALVCRPNPDCVICELRGSCCYFAQNR